MRVFSQGNVADPVQPVLDVPLQPRPVLELIGPGVFDRQRQGQVRGLAAGFPFDGAGSGDPDGLFGVWEAEPAGVRSVNALTVRVSRRP
ncbi:hypothetical protein Pflav_012360 [Phytohabitans flavus]|uniref:Uncharacterized protein n=1 Tax=Phytohabitans flavus TaxID=1076124 RepID=A0A6F8XLY7_9ACTN|nr:hypothetical protein Pflav_012360 [Phytohabitans flavus]